MTDYNKYSYSRLLEFLEERYMHDTDSLNYAKYLLNMESQTTITALMTIYNKLMLKLRIYVYGEKYVPDDWYIFEVWAGQKSYLAFDLHKCLNENILRLFMNEQNPSEQFCYNSLANLRYCDNMDKIHNMIVEKQGGLDNSVLCNLKNTREGVYNLRKEAFEYGPGTNGMKLIEDRYRNCRDFLAKYGYLESVIETTFEAKKQIYIGKPLQFNWTTTITIIIIVCVVICALAYIDFDPLKIVIFIGACLALPSLVKGK